ncbi:unnamed protein product [Diatraea saccharalis]|uniref:Dynein intermediate chain 3, ciliary n=1 Tax=Diatraea saccharalis TaxID=40085 RepID=A0A9N9WB83_9NEOP|nr:unnamed protein product [Diatraea saccharalis]
MDISYSYNKIRKNYGRQPMFCESPVQLLDSIDPNVGEQKKYGLRNPVHQFAQVSKNMSQHYINTKRVVYTDGGANHGEGGWPKDVNFWDEEMTSRYRRRVERDDDYVDAVLSLYSDFDHFVKQNNAIEMYEMYFGQMKREKPLEKSMIRLTNVYKDPFKRPVSSISWTAEDDPKLIVGYCNRKYPILGPVNNNFTGYVWDLENPHSPLLEIDPPTACWQLVCSPVSPSIVVGGLNDGRVCMFDIREKKTPMAISPMHLAHRDPVTSVVYMQSRANTEFFSASTDGMIMWWDIRDLSQPTDALMMTIRVPPGEPASLAYSEGVSVLQFERTIPTKFLCGTDTGFVVNVNRKGKTPNETMSAIYSAQRGPVKALHRSPCIVKMFMTCGDWTINLWSDDVHTSPIITGFPQRYQPNDVAWAPLRHSSFMAVTSNGNFQYWDILRKYREPIMVLPITTVPLQKVKPHDEGRLIATGDTNGSIYVLSLSDNLVQPADRDKGLLTAMYDRETKREHILETRIKEILLKRKAEEDGITVVVEERIDEDALAKTAEDEYRKTVQEEIRRTGYSPASKSGPDSKMRRR